MYCSRRLYKGNAYEICLPIADTGITVVRFYTRGDIIIEKEPETTGDSMCFSFTEEDLASLEDGVLRYGYDDFDTNSPYVVVTPGDYSGSTLDDLLEDAFDSGYTAGQEDCSGGTTDSDLIANLQGDYFVIPEEITHLRDFALYHACFSSITIPNSVTAIGASSFKDNDCLETITIPDSVTSIGVYAFGGCSNLTAVTLGSGCTSLPRNMFSDDKSLTGITIPETVTNIGSAVFRNCTALTHITFESLIPPTLDAISGFTASLGLISYTFPIYVPCESVEAYKTAFGQYYAPRITCSGSPEPVYSAMPLTFEIISGGTIGWDNSQTNVNIEYSVDSGQTWQNFTSLNVNAGDKVMFRGTGHTGFDGPDSGVDLHASRFTASTNTYFNAIGNIHSLLSSDYTGITGLGDYGGAVFFGLFSGNTGLVSAENLKLPAQTLVGDCYRDMFANCSNLTTAPELPAHDIYWATGCYMYMFHSCNSLNYIKCLATGSVYGRTSDWVSGVSPTGTFVKAAGMTSWPSGDSGIPTGWTVVDAT